MKEIFSVSNLFLIKSFILSSLLFGQPDNSAKFDSSATCHVNANGRNWADPYYNSKNASVKVRLQIKATKQNEITDSDEIPEIWRFKGQTTLGGQSYPAVFYRDPLGKINFDRGYIWYHTPTIGPIAYVDHRGVRLNENHDTLTLKAYY